MVVLCCFLFLLCCRCISNCISSPGCVRCFGLMLLDAAVVCLALSLSHLLLSLSLSVNVGYISLSGRFLFVFYYPVCVSSARCCCFAFAFGVWVDSLLLLLGFFSRQSTYPVSKALLDDGRQNLVLQGPVGGLQISCPVRLVHG